MEMLIYLTLVKHIPEWMPGASFQRKARLMREDREKLYDVPFDFVISQTVSLVPLLLISASSTPSTPPNLLTC